MLQASAKRWNIHEEAVVKSSRRESAGLSNHPFGIPALQAASVRVRASPIHCGGVIGASSTVGA